MLQRAGYATLGCLAKGLREGLPEVPGMGAKKWSELFEPVFAKIKAPAIRSKVLILTIASGSQNVSHCLVKQGPVRPSAEAPHQTLLGRGH